MSADDGIYIFKTKGGPYKNYAGRPDFYYRINHCQAIENIEDEPNYKGFNLQALMSYFGHCHVEYDEAAAFKYAHDWEERQHKELGFYPEYGVGLIDASQIDWYEMEDWDCNIGDAVEIRRRVVLEMLDFVDHFKGVDNFRQWMETTLPEYFYGESPKDIIANGKGIELISRLKALAQGNIGL